MHIKQWRLVMGIKLLVCSFTAGPRTDILVGGICMGLGWHLELIELERSG